MELKEDWSMEKRSPPQSGVKTIFKSEISKKPLYVKGNDLRVSKRSPLQGHIKIKGKTMCFTVKNETKQLNLYKKYIIYNMYSTIYIYI